MPFIQTHSFTVLTSMVFMELRQSFIYRKENVLPVSLLIASPHVVSFLRQCWHSPSPETKKNTASES